jgi:lipopolysaccharide/colanic/teichoic acid biosynthesis glycosyltransferase
MEIFARKHYGSSWLFLAFLRGGIYLRSMLAYLSLYRWEAGFALADVLSLNAAMLLGAYLWKGRVFAFPDYAYPTVFFVVSAVTLLSMIVAGEYSPYAKPSIRRAFSGLMIAFFGLSALTYFFKDYAFSRGVLLLTIGIGIGLAAGTRVLARLFERIAGGEAERRIAFVGDNPATQHLVAQLGVPGAASLGKLTRASIVGVITTEAEHTQIQNHHHDLPKNQDSPEELHEITPLPVIGNISYLRKIIEQYGIHEVIITDTAMPRAEIVRHIMEAAQTAASQRATFRFAQEYDDVIASRIVEKYVGGTQAPTVQYNLAEWKYRLFKRIFDIVGAIFLLTIGLPFVILRNTTHKDKNNVLSNNVRHRTYRNRVRDILDVLGGKKSIIGVYPVQARSHANFEETESPEQRFEQQTTQELPPAVGKIGLTGLAHLHSPETLSRQALHSLNEFYVQQYSVWLDVDILVAMFFRRR